MPTPFSFDPIFSGNSLRVSTPYQFWQGNLPNEIGGVVHFIINERSFSTTVSADGSWSFQPPLFFNEGSHNLAVQVIDEAGNRGTLRQVLLDVDLSAPAKPAITTIIDDVGNVRGPIGSGHTIDDTSPILKGYAEPGSVVRLYNHQQWIGSTVAGQNGEWTIVAELGNGTHQLQVTATDEFDRVSEFSNRYDLQINAPTEIPATISYATDDVGTVHGRLNSGASTDDFAPLIVGRAEPNSIVYLYAQNKHGGIGYKGSVQADANGEWAIQSRSMISGDGLYTFHATYVNSIADYRPDFALNLKASHDLNPVIDFARDDAGAMTGAVYHRGVTDDKNPVLEGRGAPHSFVEVEYKLSNGNWQSAGSVQVDAQGNWQFDSIELTHYGEWDFRARGLSGDNASGWSAHFELIMIPGAPLAPTIDFASDDVGLVQSPIYSSGVTDDTTPTLQGTGTPGYVIEIDFNLQGESQRSSGSVKVGEDGKWSFTSPELHQPGTWEYQARASNGEMKSNWSSKFLLNLTDDAPIDHHHLTLQHLLAESSEGAFITSNNTQILVQDEKVKLEDILPQDSEVSDWVMQTGTVTIAGTEYHVYSHDQTDLLLHSYGG